MRAFYKFCKSILYNDLMIEIYSLLLGFIIILFFFSLIYYSASKIDESKRTETTAESKH